MGERLITFGGAALLIAIGNLFYSSILNLKIKRWAFMAALCVMHSLLLVPFLLSGNVFLLYGVFVLWFPAMFAMGVRYSDDAGYMVFLAAVTAWICGSGNAIFVHLQYPIAVQLFEGKHPALPRLCIVVIGGICDSFLIWVVLRKFIAKMKEQFRHFATWSIALQQSLVLVINACMLFSVTWFCAALASHIRRGDVLLLFVWVCYFAVSVINVMAFQMAGKISERNEIAANLKRAEREAQENKAWAELVTAHAERENRWRHDMNALLQSVVHAAPSGELRAMAEKIGFKISSVPVIPKYSGILCLDITLGTLADEARAKGVRLDVSVRLPEPCPIPGEELVRMFSNLLNNAARAAACMPELSQRVVEVTAHHAAGFLYINTRNRFREDASPHGTGRGAAILQKFAKQYHGSYRSAPEGDVWVASLSLML